jgi:hypothetical protein
LIALVLAIGIAAIAPAGAHTSDPTIVTRIDAVEPHPDGVTIEVRAGVADQLLAVNTTPTPLTILATGGEPFLRIGQHQVEANLASPDWYLSNSPLGLARIPGTATPRAAPRWLVVARSGSWGWFDHRLHPVIRPLTPELRNARAAVRLGDWSVPFTYGATPGRVTGHVEYRPVLGAFRSRVEHVPDGVEVDVLDGRVPGLFLRWRGSGTLTVGGIAGEPFARLTPTTAEVNAASETWQDDQRLRGTAPTAAADPARPQWRVTGTAPRLTWLDRRLAYAPGVPPDAVLRSRRVTTMVEWDVPVNVAGRAEHVTGTTTWVPSATAPQRHPWPLYAAAALAAVAGLAVLRRKGPRRR